MLLPTLHLQPHHSRRQRLIGNVKRRPGLLGMKWSRSCHTKLAGDLWVCFNHISIPEQDRIRGKQGHVVWNITKDGIRVRDIVSPDQAWSVNGPTAPPPPPAPGTVPDPMTQFIRDGRWMPANEAQMPMVKEFKKAHDMK